MASELHADLRRAVRDLCKAFPDAYWRELDAARAYPGAFVKALTDAGYLAALIPEEYGGSGLGVTEASVILEEINRSGGNGSDVGFRRLIGIGNHNDCGDRCVGCEVS